MNKRFIVAMGIAALTLLATRTYGQLDIVHADADNGSVDPIDEGDSWTSAYERLEDALDQAESLIDLGSATRVHIFTANGTYKPDAGTGTRTLSFELRENVSIYGGFSGRFDDEETELCERDIFTNVAILSGDISGDNSYHVVRHDAAETPSRIDGVVVEDGQADGSATFGRHRGGGMTADAEDGLLIINCSFRDNVAGKSSSPHVAGLGGGLYMSTSVAQEAGTFVLVSNCIFHDNQAVHAGSGGAVVLSGLTESRFVNCLFYDNAAIPRDGIDSHGGAITVGQNAGADVFNCTIADNTDGGGVGSGTVQGGGIFVQGSPSSGRLDVDSSILWDNTNAEIGDDSPSTLNVTVVYSDVDGGYTGTGNQNVTPGFVSQSTGDYRLAGTSALLDDGNPSPSSIDASDVDDDGNTREEAPDLDHEARRQDDGIEPGAYEIAGEECGADVDGDDDVDFVDLVTLLADYDDPYTFVDLLLVIAQYGCGTTDPDCPGTEGLDEIIKDAGLSDADWKTLIDCIETGTTSEQINCACWLQHYLEDCVPSCPNLPDCPDDDPLSKH